MFEALSEESRTYLLKLVRESIETKYNGDDFPRNPPADSLLQEPCGAFVTLKNSGMLRGCIGRMESDRPLWETVAMMARAAAFEDPRFDSVSRNELQSLSVEISVLTPYHQEYEIHCYTHCFEDAKGVDTFLKVKKWKGGTA